jgi:hypothetical protein
MPVEIIGEAGTPGASREWIDAECQLAIKHLKKVCGEPPPEMDLEVQWQEHDLGEYPTIVLTWEDAMRGAPWEYIEKCEEVLTEYENR